MGESQADTSRAVIEVTRGYSVAGTNKSVNRHKGKEGPGQTQGQGHAVVHSEGTGRNGAYKWGK